MPRDLIAPEQSNTEFAHCQAAVPAIPESGADEYIDGMLALGWMPYLVTHRDGRTSLFERYPDRPDAEAVMRGRALSSHWMETEDRQAAVRRRMAERGLAHREANN